MSNISAEEFGSLVKTHFGFLVDEYDFSLKKNSDWSYDIVSPATKVSVFVEKNTLVVGVEPIGETARELLRNNILPGQFSVSVIARSLSPSLDYKVIWDEPIPTAMERKAQLLKKYCVEILNGDFTKWAHVINTREIRK